MKIDIEYIRKALARYERRAITKTAPEITHASVLFPLLPMNGELHVLLTVRTNDVETHKGQISFPGGASDSGDTDSVATALREAEEEIDLHRNALEILGALDDLQTPTQFLITPVVGYIANVPKFTPNKAEVAEILIVPLSFFADVKNGWTEERTRNGKTFQVWFFKYGKHLIWRATAAIIKRFLEILTLER